MKRLDIPFMFIGPAGSGKTKELRWLIEEENKGKITYPLETRIFTVGDSYESRVFTSPYHFEIDIPNLSMQDKKSETALLMFLLILELDENPPIPLCDVLFT